MPRIVMKFGGTSMAGIERIRSVASRVKREAEAGNEVLVGHLNYFGVRVSRHHEHLNRGIVSAQIAMVSTHPAAG